MGLIRLIKKYKHTLIIVMILLICSIAIAFGVYAQITHKSKQHTSINNENVDHEDLKNNFDSIFTNSINKEATAKLNVNYNEIVYTRYNINDEKAGKYSVDIKIPGFKGDSEVLNNINKEIYDVFAVEVLKIAQTGKLNVKYNIDYVAYVNNDIISLVIMCKYKDGSNAQRKIIQTYNYDIKQDKLLSIEDVINYKKINKDEMQKKVTDEIKKINRQKQGIKQEGYNVYVRDESSEIYKIENTPNFFLGKNNYLYLVYAYGNNNYTSEMDLIIF